MPDETREAPAEAPTATRDLSELLRGWVFRNAILGPEYLATRLVSAGLILARESGYTKDQFLLAVDLAWDTTFAEGG